MNQALPKFSNPKITAKGQPRAWVEPFELTTLWFNTGTQCNLTCQNCYIESSPTNDRLVYMSPGDIKPYLEEVKARHGKIREIGLTGGEPFLNPMIIPILTLLCEQGYRVLILTNAMKPMQHKFEALKDLFTQYPKQLHFRVSVDHYTKEIHEEERGPRAWEPMLVGVSMLVEASMPVSIAGRSLTDEKEAKVLEGYQSLFDTQEWPLKATSPQDLTIFAEMNPNDDVPEITTACWSILKKDPRSIMCATSRMVVKKKGKALPEVIACTLLPYEEEFSIGQTLQESWKSVSLNHAHCATFCVLGGSSCS